MIKFRRVKYYSAFNIAGNAKLDAQYHECYFAIDFPADYSARGLVYYSLLDNN